MERREFLVGLGLAVLIAPLAAATGCGGGGGGSSTSPTPANGFDVQSSVNSGHSHAVRVLDEDLSNPPAGGVAYTSTNANGHSHQVMLSSMQCSSIHGGQTVTVMSSMMSGHQHTWTIRKP